MKVILENRFGDRGFVFFVVVDEEQGCVWTRGTVVLFFYDAVLTCQTR